MDPTARLEEGRARRRRRSPRNDFPAPAGDLQSSLGAARRCSADRGPIAPRRFSLVGIDAEDFSSAIAHRQERDHRPVPASDVQDRSLWTASGDRGERSGKNTCPHEQPLLQGQRRECFQRPVYLPMVHATYPPAPHAKTRTARSSALSTSHPASTQVLPRSSSARVRKSGKADSTYRPRPMKSLLAIVGSPTA